MIVYLNGRLMPLEQARISPLDRGFIFGEAIYEGLRAFVPPGAREPRIVGARLHAERMNAGLAAAGIGFDAFTLLEPTLEMLRANRIPEAFVYWQVSGGTPGAGDPPRYRVAPAGIEPTVFMYCSAQPALAGLGGSGSPPRRRVIVAQDVRWMLGQMKSTSLMGNVHVARLAAAAGADEAVLVRDAKVVEGLATNVVMVVERGGREEVVTPTLDSAPMLAGVTRRLLLDFAPEIVERPVLEVEVATAREVMMVGTTTYVTACTHVDGRAVGDGDAGPAARRLFAALMDGILAGRDV